MDKCYLLSLEDFMKDACGEKLLETAYYKVDRIRRERAEGMRSGKGRIACLGAGLLLQMVLQESGADEIGESDGLTAYSVSQVLRLLGEPLEPIMEYGEKGKPYLKEYPFFFNLSHSGEYVVCAVSDREVGVDIQECISADTERLARRFFSKKEYETLAACEPEEEKRALFFRLWTRKEAYGKLLGTGIMGAIEVNLLPGAEEEHKELSWLEWDVPKGYRAALCRRREGNKLT